MDSNNMYQNQQSGGSGPDSGQNGYNQNAYTQGDYSQNAYTQGDYSQNAYTQNGYNQNPYTQGDNNQNTYTQSGYNQNPYTQGNYNQNTYNANYQQNPYNGSYQPYQYSSQNDLEEPVKMSEWVVSFLVMMVPCVNIIMMFIWAFSSSEKKSKSNYFKVALIFMAISFVLSIALSSYASKFLQYYYYYH